MGDDGRRAGHLDVRTRVVSERHERASALDSHRRFRCNCRSSAAIEKDDMAFHFREAHKTDVQALATLHVQTFTRRTEAGVPVICRPQFRTPARASRSQVLATLTNMRGFSGAAPIASRELRLSSLDYARESRTGATTITLARAEIASRSRRRSHADS